jgi:Tol biopolymer transport system component
VDELRERVRRDLERIEPSPDGLEATLRRAGRRELRRRLSAGALAMVVAAGGIALGARAFLGSEPPRPVAPGTAGAIAFDMDGDIWVVNPDGAGLRNLTDTDDLSESAPAWSPDGRRIAFVACAECTTSDLYVMDADGTNVVRLTDDRFLAGSPAWSPDGAQIAFHKDEHAGDEERWDRDLWVVNADGTGERRLTDGPTLDGGPAWSPDGTTLAFNRLDGPTESSAIYVVSPDGSGERRLTDPWLWATSPAWSPDGLRIAFDVIDRDTTTPSVYVMEADGTGVRRITDDPPASVHAWSPDGEKLLIGRLGVRHSLHVLDLETGEDTTLFTSPGPQREGVYIHSASWGPLATAGPSPPEASPSPTEREGPPASGSRLYLAGDGELWVVDVASSDVTHVDVPRLSPGDAPHRIVRRDGGLVAWGYETLVFDPDRPAHPEVLAADSWIFIPSAAEDRVWVGILDPQSPETVRGLQAVREVTVDGEVTVPDTAPPGGEWPVAAVEEGLVFQEEDSLRVWDPRTGEVVRRLPGVYPLAWQGHRLAWCDLPCEDAYITDFSSGTDHAIRLPEDIQVFHAYEGAFSPDGTRLALIALTDRQYERADAQLVLVDVGTGEAEAVRGTVVEPHYPFVDWSASGGSVFIAGGDGLGGRRIIEHRPAEDTARILPVEVGEFYDMAAL